MRALTHHSGRAVALRRSDVDTDQIIPADFCKRITKSGFADGLFARWRREEADFVLNDPGWRHATVLLADANFGTGSSREHAVWALMNWGFAVVIAPSYGDIFQRNALKNGLLAITLEEAAVKELMAAAESGTGLEVTVDLRETRIQAGERSWPFTIDERARWLILNGYDDIDVTLQRDATIEVYERRRWAWLPQVRPQT